MRVSRGVAWCAGRGAWCAVRGARVRWRGAHPLGHEGGAALLLLLLVGLLVQEALRQPVGVGGCEEPAVQPRERGGQLLVRVGC
jgi:hypothetical protein